MSDVKVKLPVLRAEVEVPTNHEVLVKPRAFVLSDASCSVGGNNGAVIPAWLDEAIANQLSAGTLTIMELVTGLDAVIRGIETGVNQQISSLQTEDINLNTLITTNVSRIDTDTAAITTELDTKVNNDEATTLFTNLLTSQFNTPESDANAWIVGQTATLANSVQANATAVNALVANYNGLSASVINLQHVTVDVDGYSLGAATFGTAPDGSITGWSFVDGSNIGSNFLINADKFQLQNANGTATPLVIDAIDPNNVRMTFNGIIDFTATNEENGFTGTTTINGGLIETDTILAEHINTVGLIAENFYGTDISGKNIHGSYIDGAIIVSSFIDTSSSSYLTDWATVDDISTIPIDFRNNLAKDQNGEYVVDANGFYRLLMSQAITIVSSTTYNDFRFNDTLQHDLNFTDILLYPYNCYEVMTMSRTKDSSPIFQTNSDVDVSKRVVLSAHGLSRQELYVNFEVLGDTYEGFLDFSGGIPLPTHTLYFKKNGVDSSITSSVVNGAYTKTYSILLGDYTYELMFGSYQQPYGNAGGVFELRLKNNINSITVNLSDFDGQGALLKMVSMYMKTSVLINGLGCFVSVDDKHPDILVQNI